VATAGGVFLTRELLASPAPNGTAGASEAGG
jgi:hypothetical protein